ncbi:hypothetical protein H072_5247 [Dactylellina haptotyla CBS 200.50]|uniref:Uncharacterized protein n=1 Tax=Dactylellina haptotyla (strain CBS 200.50) TaxID=1284197 RepID=S8BN56_DACHA|nr:hypothetical protein H072_5247 [Dactylellina haptotyla CBS 200.50]
MAPKSTTLQLQQQVSVTANEQRPPPTRLARHYVAVERQDLDFSLYPSNVESLVPKIHDIQYSQGILRNDRNFSPRTNCEIFKFVHGQGSLVKDVDDIGVDKYLVETTKRSQVKHPEPETHVIFCSLVKPATQGPNFRLQSSLSRYTANNLLDYYHISPQFLPFLLGEPNYGSPGSFSSYDVYGYVQRTEFFCQHPRWNILENQQPWSIYMTFDIQARRTFYLVVTGVNCSKTALVKDRLFQTFCRNEDHNLSRRSFEDPFFIHTLIAHESLNDLKPVMTVLRTNLYDQLDEVDAYAKKPSDRRKLEKLTTELHEISQNADSLLASADMAIMVSDRMLESHQIIQQQLFAFSKYDEYHKTADALSYLRYSAQTHKRWLTSYKNRKDIAMNLVYNLVTQQDAYTNILIAREAKRDGASMKIIAALTTFFLPATFVATIFGMSFFDFQSGVYSVSKNIWIYAAVTLPLMIITILVWWMWDRISDVKHTKKLSFTRRESVTDDIEALKGKVL